MFNKIFIKLNNYNNNTFKINNIYKIYDNYILLKLIFFIKNDKL